MIVDPFGDLVLILLFVAMAFGHLIEKRLSLPLPWCSPGFSSVTFRRVEFRRREILRSFLCLFCATCVVRVLVIGNSPAFGVQGIYNFRTHACSSVWCRQVELRRHVGNFDLQAMEEMINDPQKMHFLHTEVEQLMKDPAQKRMVEEYQSKMLGAVEQLRMDPSLTEFFADVERHGLKAVAKYERDESILRKLASAVGGVSSELTAPAAGVTTGFHEAPPRIECQPGDIMTIVNLEASRELNGRNAVVLPMQIDEQSRLRNSGRVLVRMLDSGGQFAIRQKNLQIDHVSNKGPLSGGGTRSAFGLVADFTGPVDPRSFESLQRDPAFAPVFEDIRKRGFVALEDYWNDESLLEKISRAMAR